MSSEKDNYVIAPLLFALLMVCLDVYSVSYEWFRQVGATSQITDEMMRAFADAGFFRTPYTMRLWTCALLLLSMCSHSGSSDTLSWRDTLLFTAAGLVLFFFPAITVIQYVVTTLLGFVMLAFMLPLLGRKLFSGGDVQASDESFEQCSRKIENEYSINIPTRYRYKHSTRHGWLNVVAPFRASMVLGTPGSGKSYSIYGPFIEQMIAKGYTMFVYDYKYPDLTYQVYNEYLDHYQGRHDAPDFCVINFNDPRYSMRCNPIHPDYLKDIADASEVADLIMRNVNPTQAVQENFFTNSATAYIAALIWFLRCYKNGIHCTFPALIELMGRDYESVFRILQMQSMPDGTPTAWRECKVLIQPFQNALQGNAQEQLQGQIASAQIPLVKFASPSLYWVLSGNDFKLDINNPEHPMIVCMGNDPDRQAIYGTTLALFTSRMFKLINHTGRRPCGVLLDELPTIRLKGLDNLIATARSNKVAIVLGAQDKSQLIRDYSDKEAEVIFNTVGNIFSGQVNGRTARDLCEMFGREWRLHRSRTTGGENTTTSTSFQKDEILPQARIENLSTGTFFGRIADDYGYKIERKLFCAEVVRDAKKMNRRRAHWKPIPRQDGDLFNDGKIESMVRANAAQWCVYYLSLEQEEKDREQSKRSRFHTPRSEAECQQEAEKIYSRMSQRQKEGYLEGCIEKEKNLFIDKVVRANYDAIVSQISDIFIDLDVPERRSRTSDVVML